MMPELFSLSMKATVGSIYLTIYNLMVSLETFTKY